MRTTSKGRLFRMKSIAVLFTCGLFVFIAPLVFAYPSVPRPWQPWGKGTLEMTVISGGGLLIALACIAALLSEWIGSKRMQMRMMATWNEALTKLLEEREEK